MVLAPKLLVDEGSAIVDPTGCITGSWGILKNGLVEVSETRSLKRYTGFSCGKFGSGVTHPNGGSSRAGGAGPKLVSLERL